MGDAGSNIQLEHSQHLATDTQYPLCLLAHDIESAENVGSLFRIADALGLEKIYISGTSPAPPNSKLRKTSRATDQSVSYDQIEDPLACISSLKADGYTVLSLEITSRSIALSELSITSGSKICLIVGSENTGVEQALLDISDTCVHIPMLGQNSSMNVAMACAIASYEITRQL